MKKISIILILFVIIGAFAGCKKTAVSGEIPKDVPQDFAFRFEFWIEEERKNILDTFDGYIQKDLVNNGTEKKDYTISGTDAGEIYRNIYSVKDISREMNSENLSLDETRVAKTPLTCYVITFRADGKTYTIRGDATAKHYKESSVEAENFCDAVNYLLDFLHNTETYKSMPEPQGGYC